jgi:uncharacterized protein YgbK (DUF1537 family)
MAEHELVAARPSQEARALVALSDDLTGAAALAAELWAAGLPSVVSAWSTRPVVPAGHALVVDTSSRQLDAGDAGDRIAAAVRSSSGARLGLFKRIDSGLRGNVAAELRALREATDLPLVLAVAAPELGVTTVAGVQMLDGLSVTASHLGQGGDAPASSRLTELLPGALAGLDIVRGGSLASWLLDRVGRGTDCICDAESEEDLALIAAAVASPLLRNAVVPVGSVGFARLWLEAHGPALKRPRPVLAAVSSLKPASLRQVEIAALRGATVVHSEDGQQSLADASAALRAGNNTVLVSSPRGRFPDSPGPASALALAERVIELAREHSLGGLVLVGGDLGSALLERCRTRASVVAAPWPATALLRLGDGPLDGQLTIFKSGSQGGPGWLDHALSLLASLTDELERARVR